MTELILIHLFFLGLLFYYQKKEKIYIGYTTVLCIVFIGIIGLALIEYLLLEANPLRYIYLCIGVLGSLLIYVTSQLTLAFEKISKLSQALAIRDLKKDTLSGTEKIHQSLDKSIENKATEE
jgi:hypothetical protein